MIVLYLIVIFISNIIQTLTGFAGTMLAMPLSINIIGYQQAKFILNLLGLLVSLYISASNYKYLKYKPVFKIVSLMTIGMILSKFITNTLDFKIITALYGIFIVSISIYQITGKVVKLSKVHEFGILLIAGIIHGLFVSGGALLVLYANNLFKTKNEFRANVSICWVFLNSILLCDLIKEGIKIDYALTIQSTIVMILAVILGNLLYEKINLVLFKKITNILLILTGLSILF